jgi:hypothetical protein
VTDYNFTRGVEWLAKEARRAAISENAGELLPEHLLSGILVSSSRSEAGLIFAELDIEPASLGVSQPPSHEDAQHELPYHEAAKDALFNALAISAGLGHTSTGADHVLLSLVREAPAVRKRLAEAGVDEDVLMATLVKCRSGKK